MRLTNFTDYSLRVLLYAAAHPGQQFTIDEVTNHYQVSRGHMMKVVNLLTKEKFLSSIRGRTGGLKLGLAPEQINLADVLIASEPDFEMAECMRSPEKCILVKNCKLISPLSLATAAFLDEMRKYTLADVMLSPEQFAIS